MKPKRLIELEQTRLRGLKELELLFERVGFKVFPIPLEEFNVSSYGISMSPVTSFQTFADALPTDFVLAERTQINRVLLNLKDADGAYAFVMKDHRGHFVGAVLTDMFFQRPTWLFSTLHRSHRSGVEIKRLLVEQLEKPAREVEEMRLLYESVTQSPF